MCYYIYLFYLITATDSRPGLLGTQFFAGVDGPGDHRPNHIALFIPGLFARFKLHHEQATIRDVYRWCYYAASIFVFSSSFCVVSVLGLCRSWGTDGLSEHTHARSWVDVCMVVVCLFVILTTPRAPRRWVCPSRRPSTPKSRRPRVQPCTCRCFYLCISYL